MGRSLRPFLWTHVATTVTGFTARTEIDLPVTCTYDFEVAGTKYFHALDDGEIPLVLLFSGTTFSRGDAGLSVDAGGVARGGLVPAPGRGVAGDDGPLLPEPRLAHA